MKTRILVVVLLLLCLSPESGVAKSQQDDKFIVAIEITDDTDFSLLQGINVYFRGDDYVIAGVEEQTLESISKAHVSYKVIDTEPWTKSYYLISRPRRAPLEPLPTVGKVIFQRKNEAVIKIDAYESIELIEQGFSIFNITPVLKPLPLKEAKPVKFQVIQDSLLQIIVEQVSDLHIANNIQRLQDFQTRYAYSDSIYSASQWLYEQFLNYGYTDVVFDTFYVGPKLQRNVIATKTGQLFPDSVLIIGGHYDSYVRGSGTNYYVWAPGADDNASGTTATLEVARILASVDLEATVRFACWAAEEVGLRGSYHFAEEADRRGDRIGLYLNFDMIGNLNPSDPLRDVKIYTDTPSFPYAQLMADMAQQYTSLVPRVPGNSGGSDHVSFQQFGYRALYGQEGDFSPNWHRNTDTIDNINIPYTNEVIRMGLATLAYLAGPMENSIDHPYVKYVSYQIDDDQQGESWGNGNSFVDPGETIELPVTLRNYGDSLAYNVTAVLSASDSYVTMKDSIEVFGVVAPGASVNCEDDFDFVISPQVPARHQIKFYLRIKDEKDHVWYDMFYLQVKQPELSYYQRLIEEVSGDGDDIIEPGEVFNLYITLQNKGLREARDIHSVLRTTDPNISILDSLADFSDIPVNATGNNTGDPWTFQVNANSPLHIVQFDLSISEGMGFYTTQIEIFQALGQSRILLVEDDGKNNNVNFYTEAMDGLGLLFDYWDTDELGPVSEDTLKSYRRVIWFTGHEFNSSLFKYGLNPLMSYLDDGGALFINGSLLGLAIKDSSFYSDYLQAKFVSYNTKLHHLKTEGTDPVLGEASFRLETSGPNAQGFPGEIDPLEQAFTILKYDTATSEGNGNIKSSGSGAIAIDSGTYRAVYFSFGWEGISDFRVRQEVLVDVLNWLQQTPTSIKHLTQLADLPGEFLLFQNYPNPFNPVTQICYQVAASRGKNVNEKKAVSIKIYNVLGQEVRTLVDSKKLPGIYSVHWDGTDELGTPVAAGIYFYRFVSGNFHQTKKMLFLP